MLVEDVPQLTMNIIYIKTMAGAEGTTIDLETLKTMGSAEGSAVDTISILALLSSLFVTVHHWILHILVVLQGQ